MRERLHIRTSLFFLSQRILCVCFFFLLPFISRANFTVRLSGSNTYHYTDQRKRKKKIYNKQWHSGNILLFARKFGRSHDARVTRWLAQDTTCVRMDGMNVVMKEWYVQCHYLCARMQTVYHKAPVSSMRPLPTVRATYFCDAIANGTESTSHRDANTHLLASVFYSHFSFYTFFFAPVRLTTGR